ncbi:MAG TPA: hypothetical protein VFM82_02725 [Flavobacteriaceae bacterium]|nr:hypothetical protein [Flavobacteriaceae bacterium]
MDIIEIKSAKIKNDLFLDFTYREKKEIKTDDINQSSDLPFHDDCKQAFLDLLPHFILICEQEKSSKLKKFIQNGVGQSNEPPLQNYEITAFKIGGTGDNEGVTLTGKKFLSSGKTLNLNSPFIRFSDEDYKFTYELSEVIEILKNEVFQYMTGEKHAPLAQQSLEFEDEAFGGETEDTFNTFKEKGYRVEINTNLKRA